MKYAKYIKKTYFGSMYTSVCNAQYNSYYSGM